MFEKIIRDIIMAIVRGVSGQITKFCLASYKEDLQNDKVHDICKKNIDMSDKILGMVDWIVLKSPIDETPFSLNLRGSNVKDQDLIDHLVGQKFLRRLDVCFCHDITYRGVRKFRKLRPDCEVLHNTVPLWQYILCFSIMSATAIQIIVEFFF